MCVGLPKPAELPIALGMVLAALFFVSFFWANKRKKNGCNIFSSFTSDIIMKVLIVLSFILLTGTSKISCSFPDGSVSIKHSQYDHYYEMTAKFNPDKTNKVDRYLDKELPSGNMSFVNTEMDDDITLDDKTTFYVKKSPGYLNIKLDKEKNSEEAFTKLKGVLEGIGEAVR